MNQGIFRKKSLERIASPDKLDDCLKACSPSAWMILAALLVVLAAAAVWCFFGAIPTTAAAVGIRGENGAVCFVSAAEGYAVEPGMAVRFTPAGGQGSISGQVEQVAQPLAAVDAAGQAGAVWLSADLPGDWVCPVFVRLDDESAIPQGAVCEVQVILEERRLIELLFGSVTHA